MATHPAIIFHSVSHPQSLHGFAMSGVVSVVSGEL
jgi:hypothetical protein